MNPLLIYFSSQSENTRRFIDQVGLPAIRIPIRPSAVMEEVTQPYILVVPSYGGGTVIGAVPRQVIHFLNNPSHRHLLRGVIAAGNRNFGEAYGIAGDIIARKCQVPCLYRFELSGMPEDVENVRKGVNLWLQQNQ
ncbi:ribonucleotide reductase assembly protein NrdI [Lonsdalea britannica]|uniref:Protein NrdI n=1 Tax=Lonsdalea britannica TaxID=1082704 RepID=A0AAD0SI15_9GAMM|nr:class Ib ribonucleoside-diphosphate reductase assembly flavoprotein NrdI [Lonsdalea britannica]AXW85628.1 class Ib ribonucleoside-diphosphate reductase assembly flavoprotein NrdI [Lonsdalea britannica]OSM96460.1 ribonucleotide reductase assembly protein NrdI [Lonsdalea britannica]OSN08987.1 ribonucleotide reductase assembly protein NrdI [Lonsdalea britannica]